MQNTFSLKVNGKSAKVKMTMGLLHEICAVIGHVELLAEASYNPEIRHDLLVSLLSPRDEDGEITEEIKVKTLDANPEEILALLAWAVEHAADFLLQTLQGSKKMLEQRKETLTGLMPT